MDLPGYKPNTKPHNRQIREAAKLIAAARKPVLYTGGGVIRGQACEQLRELAELTGIPVVTTLMARGAFPDSHPQNLGMPGMHGTVAAVAGLQRADLLIALGTRFDDRVTGQLESFAPEAKVIHADIDPAEIGKNRNADVPIVGDVAAVITDLIAALRHAGIPGSVDLDPWWEYLREVRATYPLSYGPQSDGSLSPEYVIATLGRLAGPEAVYVAGVGQHQMWAAQFIGYENPRTWINSGGLGTMGFAIPAAMGAKIARPEAEVWAVDGDGCFQMTNQELATCAIEGAPIKVALINNGNLGMVRQWQSLFYEGRYSHTDLSTHSRRIPDFVKLAEALGCVGLRCEREEDVADVIAQARAINDRPVVIDFVVGADAQVWPMVAAGTSNDEIQAARGIRPLFDDDNNEGHA
jgi:acetolactate synthase-1/2/3 large subunit